MRRHRSFDNRACRTTLRETGQHTAADVYQPYLRCAPHGGRVFILSFLSTVNATHVSPPLLGRAPQKRSLDFLGLAQPHYLVVDVPRAVPRAASPQPVDCTLMPPVAVSSQ